MEVQRQKRKRQGVQGPLAKLLSRCLVGSLTATLTACGGENTAAVGERCDLPLQTALDAHQAPVVVLDGRLHVGGDVAAPGGSLPVTTSHGDAEVSHGTIRDGVGEAELIAYLQADAFSYGAADDANGSDV